MRSREEAKQCSHLHVDILTGFTDSTDRRALVCTVGAETTETSLDVCECCPVFKFANRARTHRIPAAPLPDKSSREESTHRGGESSSSSSSEQEEESTTVTCDHCGATATWWTGWDTACPNCGEPPE